MSATTTFRVVVAGEVATAAVPNDLHFNSGSVGTYIAEFAYDDGWSGLTLEAVFVSAAPAWPTNPTATKSLIRRSATLANDSAAVHADVLTVPGNKLWVGLSGLDSDGTIVKNSILVYVGTVQNGADVDGPGNGDIQETRYEKVMQAIADGVQGPQGPQGETGKSAYDMAVENGYEGTEEEFWRGPAEFETLKTAAENAAETATKAAGTAEEVAALVEAIVAGNEAYTKRESDLRYANSIIQSASGESIAITDSAVAPLHGLNIYGKTEQITATGAQLLNYEGGTPYNTDNCVINADGSINFHDTTTAAKSYALIGLSPYITLKAGVTYTISVSKVLPVNIRIGNKLNCRAGNLSYTYTPTEDESYNHLGADFFGTGYFETGDFFVMLNEGTTALPWEHYTGGKVTPDITYPQELNSVGDSGEIGIVINGDENLFDYETWSQTTPPDGASFEDNGIVFSGDESITHDVETDYTSEYSKIPCTPGITYSISFESTNFSGGLKIYPNGGTPEMILGETPYYEYTPAEGVEFFAISAWAFPFVSGFVKNIQVNKKADLIVSVTNGLPGVPYYSDEALEGLANHTDANGKQWICDEIDFARGVYIQRVGKLTLDGTEAWTQTGATAAVQIMTSATLGKVLPGRHRGLIGDRCRAAFGNSVVGNGYFETNGYFYLVCYAADHEFTFDVVTDWEMYLASNPMTIYYVLKTPVETELSAEELVAYANLRTTYPETVITNDAGAEMAVDYVADTKNYIDNKFTALQNAVLSLGGNV